MTYMLILNCAFKLVEDIFQEYNPDIKQDLTVLC